MNTFAQRILASSSTTAAFSAKDLDRVAAYLKEVLGPWDRTIDNRGSGQTIVWGKKLKGGFRVTLVYLPNADEMEITVADTVDKFGDDWTGDAGDTKSLKKAFVEMLDDHIDNLGDEARAKEMAPYLKKAKSTPI